jgi:hypothetical protein
MRSASEPALDDAAAVDPPPGWVAPGAADAVENTWFLAGAALAALHPAASGRRPQVPLALLRERLALQAAEACVRMAGRAERAADLRDAVHLLRPGDSPGPAGAIHARWRAAVVQPRPARGKDRRATACPVAQAAAALAAALDDRPDDATGALIAAEATLARALGWPGPTPVIAAGLARRDLAARGAALEAACARAIAATAPGAARLAADLARRAARLRAAAPRLRAKGAAAAVALLLNADAVYPPTDLSPVVRGNAVRMSDRAARRLCERLVALGVVRELTGRASFRLYGL